MMILVAHSVFAVLMCQWLDCETPTETHNLNDSFESMTNLAISTPERKGVILIMESSCRPLDNSTLQ